MSHEVAVIPAPRSGDLPPGREPNPVTPPGQETTGGAASRLAHLPVTLFSVVLGVGGTAIAWRRGHDILGWPALGTALVWAGLAIYLGIGGLYLAKVVRHWSAATREWRHPIASAFLPAVTIAPMVLATGFLEIAPGLSALLWWVGAVGQLALTLTILNQWIDNPALRTEHTHPGWFMPVVGNLVAPLAGVVHAPIEVSWFLFSIGVAYWLILVTLLHSRLFLGQPLPAKLTPTMAILMAPPAVAFLSYLRLGGQATDPLARILLGMAVFQTLLLATRAGRLRRVGFFLSWWAMSFPLAAVATSLLVYSEATGSTVARVSGAGILALVSAIVLGLGGRTAVAVARREICRPD